MDDIDKLIAIADNKIADHAATEAAEMGQPLPGQPGGPEVVPTPTNADAIAGMLTMGREMAVQAFDFKSPRVTLSDQNIGLCAAAIGPALDHYGINLGGTVATNPAINAVFVAGPILWEAAKALRDELEERRRQREAQAGLTFTPPPGGNVVSLAGAEVQGPNG